MGWVGVALVVVVAAIVVLAWWIGATSPRQEALRSSHGNVSAGPEAFDRRPLEGPYGGAGRLELPPGPEGHLMAAEALHRATGMYRDVCEERMR